MRSKSDKMLYRGPMGSRPPMFYDGNAPTGTPFVGSEGGGFNTGFGPTGGSYGNNNFGGGFSSSDGSDRPKRTGCFNCGEPGHLSKDCSQPRKQRPDCYTSERPKRGCYNCGEEGHNSRECQKPPREPGNMRGGSRGGFSGFRGSGGDRPKRGGYFFNCSEDGAHSPRGGPKNRDDPRRQAWNHPRISGIHAYGSGRGRGGGFNRGFPPSGNGDGGGFGSSGSNCFGPGDGGFAGGGFGNGGFGPGPVASGLISGKSGPPFVNNGGFSGGGVPFGGYHPPAGFGSTNSVASKSDSGELGFGSGSRRGEPNSGFGDSDDESCAKRTGTTGSNDGFRFSGDLVFFAKDFASKPQGQACANCNSEWHSTKDCTNLRKSASSNISIPDEDGDVKKLMPKERLLDDVETCEKSSTGGASSAEKHSSDSIKADSAPPNKPPATSSDIRQLVEQVDGEAKLERLTELLQSDIENCVPTSPEGKYCKKTLVFVERKRTADYLASVLSQRNVCSTSFHNDREQIQREQALNDFKFGLCSVLVATSVAARGLDIVGVDHVINYDLPKQIDDYVNRIGRTGRVGNPGRATSFYDESNDGALARELVKVLSEAQQVVPDWMQGGTSFASVSGSNGFNSFDNFGPSNSATSTWD